MIAALADHQPLRGHLTGYVAVRGEMLVAARICGTQGLWLVRSSPRPGPCRVQAASILTVVGHPPQKVGGGTWTCVPNDTRDILSGLAGSVKVNGNALLAR